MVVTRASAAANPAATATTAATARPISNADLLKRLLVDVMEKPAGHPIELALKNAGVESVVDLMQCFDSDFASLTYEEVVKNDDGSESTKIKNLRLSDHRVLLWMKYYLLHLEFNKGGLTAEDLEGIEKADFDRFRTSNASLPPIPNPPPTTSVTHQSNKTNAVNDFKKGIKRDISTYPILKDARFFDHFELQLLTQARAHDVVDVFTPSYKPRGQDEIDLFVEKQKFGMAILVHCIQTDIGCTFIREHQKDFDAQKCWAKIVGEARSSTRAELAMTDLQDRLMQARLDSNWRGTATGFLLYWKDLLRKLEDLMPDDEHYPFKVKKRLLRSAVNGHPALQSVDKMDQDQIARGQGPLDFTQYFDILQSAAALVDHEHSITKRPTKRVVNYLDMTNEEYLELTNPDIAERDVHATNMTTQGTKTKGNKDDGLFVDRDIWFKLSPQIQQAIRDARESKPPANRPMQRIAKMTEMSSASESMMEMTDDLAPDPNLVFEDINPDSETLPADFDPDVQQLLLNKSNVKPMTQADIRSVLATSQQRRKNEILNKQQHVKKTIVVDGVTYTANVTCITYNVTAHEHRREGSALIDRGANGGMAGADVKLIETTERKADVNGIDNHEVKNLPICTVAATVQSSKGPIIVIMHQFAYLGKGSTILSSGQIEAFKNHCDDRSMKVGGTQRITTMDGYVIPLSIRNGLPYMALRPPTDHELDTLPHVLLTSDMEWDPSSLDNEFTFDDDWADARCDDPEGIPPYDDNRFSLTGEYQGRHVAFMDAFSSTPDIMDFDQSIDFLIYESNRHTVITKEPDYEAIRPCFAWAPIDIIKKTFAATTQYARNSYRLPFRRHYRARFPALNVPRRQEPVATDTVFSDTPAICDGSTCAQIFVGRNSLVTDVYGMKTMKQFVNTLEDNVRKRGAMDKLISDRAQVEISGRVHDFLRALCIDDWQSEPHHQWQNFAENRWNTVKTYTNNVLNRTGAPAGTWLLCILWVCYILNHIAVPSLNYVLQWKL